MFRLLKFFIVLGTGAVLGFYYNGMLMRAECSAGEGEWRDKICVNSELVQ